MQCHTKRAQRQMKELLRQTKIWPLLVENLTLGSAQKESAQKEMYTQFVDALPGTPLS